MKNEISILLESGKVLSVMLNDDPNYKELNVFLRDKNGAICQDIAVIGEEYEYDDDLDTVPVAGKYYIKIYGDPASEDWTQKVKIEESKKQVRTGQNCPVFLLGNTYSYLKTLG